MIRAQQQGYESPTRTALSRFSALPEGPRGSHYHLVKRCIDVTLATALLVFLSPLIVAVVLAVKLDSRGPVLFAQERVGTRRVVRNGRARWELRPFTVYKFRTMAAEADEAVHERHLAALTNGHVSGATTKLQYDERVTGVGRVLRKTSIDELPQLVNVLRGEMSLVGPRPVPLYEVDGYRPEYAPRFTALPGMTGLWQVRGRCALPFREMFACDLEYVASPTIRKDLVIIIRTVPAVLSGKGAG